MCIRSVDRVVGQYGDRLNQVDLRTSKSLRMNGGRRLQLFLDLYNLLNVNPVLDYNNNYMIAAPPRFALSPATYDWPVPTSILQGRFTKIGVQLDW